MQTDARENAYASPAGAGATGRYEPPPPRDRLPTLPEDMSEYAWLNTGPRSWSDDASHAADAGECLASDAPIDDDDGEVAAAAEMDEVTAGLLVDMWHGDVPRVVAERITNIDEREAHVLSLMDGRSTVGTLLVTSVLSVRDIVATLCELRARGVVTLDRAPLR
jgi:hypothetical protein